MADFVAEVFVFSVNSDSVALMRGGKIRITSNSLPSGDATILPGKQLALRIDAGQVYESDQPQLVRQVIPGGFGPPMQQRVTGPDDTDDLD